ncbi:Gamma-aminobutyric acid receptor subunit rho-2 [Amphibalanus amphitrite]|uniref:Gamma-aminobutyric acid receptor subunit rho-2 n=2 Tax=Amphibalanus amphitrite TaxID=1232801 RepID=A0A6A4VJ15_AMPAM|nr:Gamma-aminobutyric acid receptor subunit rho-2 [Amphibalanus amphitrite]
MTKPYVQMDTDAISKLWLPNLFALFVQKVEKPELIIPAAGVHLYQDKTIFRTSLYLITVKCNMVYFNYPMDRQTCRVKIQSYIYSVETLLLEWHTKGITHEDIVMSSFYLEEIRMLPPVTIHILIDSYAELNFEMRFKRKLRFSILAVYVPSLLVVMVSWLSLWLLVAVMDELLVAVMDELLVAVMDELVVAVMDELLVAVMDELLVAVMD